MDITVVRTTAQIAGSGSIETIGDGAWGGLGFAVLADDLGLWDAQLDLINLPVGWHDIGLCFQSEDNDFSASTILEFRLGRFNVGTPQWSRVRDRDTAGSASPVRTIRGSIYCPVADTLCVGLSQNSGTPKDILVEVQIYS